MLIKESFTLTTSDGDILAAPSRLAAIPKNGVLTIEATATDADATNFGTLTLLLPNGDNPLIDVLIPANGFSTADQVMHSFTELKLQMVVSQGGHVGLAYTENGTVALVTIFATLSF